jgi:exonuclease SbcC
MAELAPMERDLAEWRFLAMALGREGVQALEMDAAGPRVAQLANDLLRSCWDGRFQVRFDTQTALASGKGMKEDFAVTVLDSRAGRETDGSDLSGGEKVVVSSAIGRAIGWFHRETSGASFDQVFVDEATGELDEEARPQYVQMMRRLLKAGGLFQVVAVSHDPGIVSMADAVVHVRDGTLRVMTPEQWREAGGEA